MAGSKGAGWSPGEVALLSQLASTARGPRRGGLFALWLTLRTAMMMSGSGHQGERARRRQLTALSKRLSSIPMSPALRRALNASLDELQDGTAAAAATALRQLVAPAEDAAGPDAAKAVARAAETARRLARAGEPR